MFVAGICDVCAGAVVKVVVQVICGLGLWCEQVEVVCCARTVVYKGVCCSIPSLCSDEGHETLAGTLITIKDAGCICECLVGELP